ncbi:MAG: hypothetical protein OXE75_12715, partial [bacterium]|nr:hypothetical protein [bacterium]
MRTRKRWALLSRSLAVFAAVVLMATACGNGEETATEPSPPPPAGETETPATGDGTETESPDPPPVAPEDEPPVIRYFSMWNEGEPQQEVLAGIIDSFEADTGVEVDVLWGGREIMTSVRA